MMKKILCVFVVLALIAQICARPNDKDDAEITAKHNAEKTAKEGRDKADEASEKDQDHADKAEEASDKLKNKGKEAAEALRKRAHGLHGGNGAESKRQQHAPKMSAIIREAEQAGEKMIKTGTNVFAGFLDKMGL